MRPSVSPVPFPLPSCPACWISLHLKQRHTVACGIMHQSSLTANTIVMLAEILVPCACVHVRL